MFGKIITAVVTPFDENNEIDFESFKKVLKDWNHPKYLFQLQ